MTDLCDGVVVVGVELSVVVLGVHDDHQVAVDPEGPAQGPRHHDDLDGSGVEKGLHDVLVLAVDEEGIYIITSIIFKFFCKGIPFRKLGSDSSEMKAYFVPMKNMTLFCRKEYPCGNVFKKWMC